MTKLRQVGVMTSQGRMLGTAICSFGIGDHVGRIDPDGDGLIGSDGRGISLEGQDLVVEFGSGVLGDVGVTSRR